MDPPPSLRRTAVVVWAALTGGLVLFTAVATRMPPTRADGGRLAAVLFPAVAGVAVVFVLLSWLLPGRIRPGGAVVTPDQLALSRSVVACALCEGPALFAVVGLMLTRAPAMLLPFALSAGALLAHYPGRSRWERLGADARPPGGPDRPRGPDRPGGPMVRG